MAKSTASNIAALTGTSDSSVEKGTGKTWKEWIGLLDQEGAADCSHKEIAAMLSKYIDSGWWCQSIAVGYEKYKGKRVLGQTSDGKFQIGVSRTLNLDKETLWDILSSEKGMGIWLGETLDSKGASTGSYRTREGITGEITVLKQGSHFRMTWRPVNWDHASTLQVRVISKVDKSVLSFHHEGLASSGEREAMKAYWAEKIDRLCRE